METIARIVTRYREFERLYLQGTNSDLESMLEEALTRLYGEILTHLAHAVRFFGEKSTGQSILHPLYLVRASQPNADLVVSTLPQASPLDRKSVPIASI